MRIILVGKSGAGISTVGNTLLGEDVFWSRSGSASVTAECQKERCEVDGTDILVVDTPGFCHTTLHKKKIKKKIAQGAELCAPGPHAIVVVLPAGRAKKEEEKTAKRILKLFGKEAERFMVVVFNHGGELGGGSLESFVYKTQGKLRKLIDACGGRRLAFSRGSRREKEEQVRELINVIDGMVRNSEGSCFQNQKALTAYKGQGPKSVFAGAFSGLVSGGSAGAKIGAFLGPLGPAAGGVIGAAAGTLAGAACAKFWRPF